MASKLFQQLNSNNHNPSNSSLQPQSDELKKIQEMANKVKNASNPEQAFKILLSSNPKLQQIMNFIQSKGGNPQTIFMNMAKMMGANPNSIISMLK